MTSLRQQPIAGPRCYPHSRIPLRLLPSLPVQRAFLVHPQLSDKESREATVTTEVGVVGEERASVRPAGLQMRSESFHLAQNNTPSQKVYLKTTSVANSVGVGTVVAGWRPGGTAGS